MSADAPVFESMAEVLTAVGNAWEELQAAVAAVPADRADEPGVCGVWSAKIAIGHVSFWNAFEAVRLRKEGELGSVDWQTMNDQNAAETAGRSFNEICDELKANHELVMTAISETPALKPLHVKELVYDHYVEHAAELRAWVASL